MQEDTGIEIIVSPGTEVGNWSAMKQRIDLVSAFTKTIHIDVIDGIFANTKTLLEPAAFAPYTKDIFFEVHFMVDNPLQYLTSFADAGFRRFIAQIEMMPDQAEFVAEAERLGEVGIAIDGPTSLEKLTVPLIDLDTLLIMTIKAGKSGQAFMPEHLEKVRQMADRNEAIIEIDGGVNKDTIAESVKAGATRFVVTSAVFNSNNPQEAYTDLLTTATNAAALPK